jgi:hypothetical protein
LGSSIAGLVPSFFLWDALTLGQIMQEVILRWPDSWSKDIVGHHLCLMDDQQLLLAEGIFGVDPYGEQLGFKLIVVPSL